MLSEATVRQAKPKDRDYKLSDSEGLHLFVAKSGHRSWRLKYRFAGKERRLVFGAYPSVSLKEARELKVEARRLLSAGRDPGIGSGPVAGKASRSNGEVICNGISLVPLGLDWCGGQGQRRCARSHRPDHGRGRLRHRSRQRLRASLKTAPPSSRRARAARLLRSRGP